MAEIWFDAVTVTGYPKTDDAALLLQAERKHNEVAARVGAGKLISKEVEHLGDKLRVTFTRELADI